MPSEFSLVKWYMDCVTDSGDAVILYCADIRWRGIHATYSSVLTAHAGLTETCSSMASYRLSSTSDEIQVEFPRLRVSGNWQTDAEPVERIVYENSAGRVHWNCLQPRSVVHFRAGDREFAGLGYAECLTLTLPPWQLPMRELRWGRFVSPSDSLAWVEWKGDYSTSFAIHNGEACDMLSASDSEIEIRNAHLRMEESISLRAGRVGSTVLPGAPALRKVFPRSLFNIDEQKWRSRGAFTASDHGSHGWVIHEVVHWKV
jgi:hypothetical protein